MDVDLTAKPAGHLLGEIEERVGIGITHNEDIDIGGGRPRFAAVPGGPRAMDIGNRPPRHPRARSGPAAIREHHGALTRVPGERLEVPVAVQQHKTGQLGDGGNEQVHRPDAAVFTVPDKNLLNFARAGKRHPGSAPTRRTRSDAAASAGGGRTTVQTGAPPVR
ncbi:hypothetical protein KBZ10_04240 [Streptomyces sp. F63]|nr:hypothetical protein [Streptomyces sp. F63]MBQ0983744.1 hypothetical protein [Streptomyces sp. F63]